jgi:predicted nucleotidyltransferase
MLENLFGSRIRARILGWLFTRSDEAFFVRQLETLLHEDAANLSRELNRLAELGILEVEKRGNQKYFKANERSAVFRELKGLVLRTVGVAGQVEDALESIEGVELAFIFGSFAKGEEHAGSDVDLMVVGDVPLEWLERRISKVERDLSREITYSLFDRKELKRRIESRDQFIANVFSGPRIMIVGSEEDELFEIAS